MPTDVQPAGDGPLSIDQAAGLLQAPVETPQDDTSAVERAPVGEPEAEAPADEPADPEIESEAVPAADDALEPEPAIEDKEEAEPEREPDEPAIAAPVSWDDAHKERFRELPRDVQEFLVTREGERDRATFKALETAAEERKRIDAEATRVKALADQITQFLPQAVQSFQSRWGEGEIDWIAVLNERGADETTRLKLEYEADQQQLQRLAAAQRAAVEETSKRETASFLVAREEGLKTLVPELCDPAQGTQRRDELAGYLLREGFSREDITTANASQIRLAWKAFQLDKGAASFKAASAEKPRLPTLNKPVAQARASVPTAAPAALPTRQRMAEQAKARLNRSGSIEDAVAVLLAKG